MAGEDPESVSAGTVSSRKAMYEGRARQLSTEKAVLDGDRSKAEGGPRKEMVGEAQMTNGTVRGVAATYQKNLAAKEANQQVLRGKKDEPVPEAKRNFVVKKSTNGADAPFWMCWCCGPAAGERR